MSKPIIETNLHKALMKCNEWSLEEAETEIQCMKNRVAEGENPEDLLYEQGLEPDYFFDLIP